MNLGIENYEITPIIEKETGTKVKLKNDAKCSALAEQKYGNFSECENGLFLCIGTGVGGAVIYNGKVLEAKKVEKSEKLLVLQVKIEDEVKQIVSGIAQYYKPEELIGSNVVVCANLKPVKIRGVESNGMILCAVDKESLEVIKTLKKGEYSKVQ